MSETFDQWLYRVERACLRLYNRSLYDGEPQPYQKYFEERVSPERVARRLFESISENLGELPGKVT